MRTFETGATRDSNEDKLQYHRFLSPQVLRRYCEYLHEHRVQADGNVRDADNWKKGMEQSVYVESLTRHFFEAWEQFETTGHIDQDTLCAVMFNSMGYLFEDLRKELQVDILKPHLHDLEERHPLLVVNQGLLPPCPTCGQTEKHRAWCGEGLNL